MNREPLLVGDGMVQFRPAEPAGLLTEIVAYWDRRRGDREMPARRDLDPTDIPALLPNVILLDVAGDPPRFRKRLVGTAIVAKEGRDSTGDWLDEKVNPAIRDEVLRQHAETVVLRRMTCYAAAFVGQDGKSYRYRRLLLPLSRDGAAVDMLFGGVIFESG